jgi:hypothetical protein
VRHREHWPDAAWWESEIDAAVRLPRPILCNLRITMTHHELSSALREVTGPNTGANFHTWAVWGSKKAGRTIRKEDIPLVEPATGALGLGVGALAGHVFGRQVPGGLFRTLLAAVAGGWAASALTRRLLSDAAQRILEGNITVLDDIGRASGRFIAAFHGQPEPDQQRLLAFLATLRPGPTAEGGQDLLVRAFTHYYRARYEPDRDARHEHMLMANYAASLHEHIRLQPCITGAMQGPLRGMVTAHLLEFELGPYEHAVDEDVEAWQGAQPENQDPASFPSGESGWDRTPDSLTGSTAIDWSDIRDRMNFIVDLFRTRHLDEGLFSEPFTEAQRRDVLAGVVPSGI